MKKHLQLSHILALAFIVLTMLSSCGAAKQLKQDKATLESSLSNNESRRKELAEFVISPKSQGLYKALSEL